MENSKIDNFLEMLDGILTHSKENPNMVNELLLNAANKKDNKKPRTWYLTNNELEKLPPEKRSYFGRTPMRIYYKKYSKYTYGYEIRFRRKGFNVYSSSKNLDEAKRKFILFLKDATPTKDKSKNIRNFTSFAKYYFETFRKRKVAPKTYQNDLLRLKKYLLPYFGEQPLHEIQPLQCQELIDSIKLKGKHKTAEEIYSLMSIIFRAAIDHDFLSKNPLNIVILENYEREHGKALTKEEEIILFRATENTEYQLMFALSLYTGMRPNELETARREGDFIVCRNSKRKNGKIEYKKIPITPMLRPFIKDIQDFTFYKAYTLRTKFNSILPNHKLYDLRTTFYSRCIECNVSEVAQKLFAGHSLGALGNAYTDVSDEYLLKEGEKINY
jgi:integrase